MLDDDPTTTPTTQAATPTAQGEPAAAPKKAVRRRATKATAPPAAEQLSADQLVPDQPVADPSAALSAADTSPEPTVGTDGEAPKKAAKKTAAKKAATPRKRATKATAAATAALTLEAPVDPELTEEELAAQALPEATADDRAAPAARTRGRTRNASRNASRNVARDASPDVADDVAGDASPDLAGDLVIEQEPAAPRRRGRAPAVVVTFQPPEPAPAAPRRRAASSAGATSPADTTPAGAPVDETSTGEPARPVRTRRRAGTSGVLTPTAPTEELDETDAGENTDETDDSGEGPRRRRRGRRGRGRRPEGEAGETESGQGDDTEDEAAEAVDGDEPTEGAAGTARRRRRRRSGAGGAEDGGEDDVPTVVHVREPGTREPREPRQRTARAPRDGGNAADEDGVRGISGSTRMAAKRVRRQEGRDSGRKRAPILTEAEFLARREAVDRVMVVRQKGDRTQIAVLEDGILVEHYVTKASATSYAGNVYLGKVQNVLPSMEAAFVDIGKGRNGVLYAGEVNYEGVAGGRSRSIESVLKGGQDVLVQVSKDPIGHKGARLTSQITLPGRYLVYVPEGSMTGISRKLPENERARLKDILKKIIPEGAGVIIRTAAEGASEEEISSDVRRLQAQWDVIRGKADNGGGPVQLHAEPDLVIKVVRDIFNEDFTRLVVSGDSEWDTIREYVEFVAPDLAPRLSQWTSERDVFAEHRIDEQLLKALDRKVHLPSGGSLVIDRTEAMIVVDVNTGKYVGKGGNLEETVTRNNLEAAEEIARQLRLRDLGGIIVVDFIDMVLESNRDLVVRRLVECLGRDRTKHQVAEVTSLGLVQMTRKRVGQGLLESFSETCEACNGRGVTLHTEPLEEPKGARQERDRAPRVGPRAPKPGPPQSGSSQSAVAEPGPARSGSGPVTAAVAEAPAEEGAGGSRNRRRRGGRGAGSAGSVNAADELSELLEIPGEAPVEDVVEQATAVEPAAEPVELQAAVDIEAADVEAEVADVLEQAGELAAAPDDMVVDEALTGAEEGEQPVLEDLPVDVTPELPGVVESGTGPTADAPKKRRRSAGRPAGAPTA